jgi:hypothetical protein
MVRSSQAQMGVRKCLQQYLTLVESVQTYNCGKLSINHGTLALSNQKGNQCEIRPTFSIRSAFGGHLVPEFRHLWSVSNLENVQASQSLCQKSLKRYRMSIVKAQLTVSAATGPRLTSRFRRFLFLLRTQIPNFRQTIFPTEQPAASSYM